MLSKKALPLAISFASTAMCGISVNAQEMPDAEDGNFRLEEVIVTARLREESLQTTPLSITAFTADMIDQRNITDVRTLLEQTPGVYFTNQGGPGLGNISIRGVAQGSLIGDESNVASFVDGFYWSGRIASEALLSGIERVEVVRGPQSALYGRNSFSGAVNYITKKPNFEEMSGGVKLTYGDNGRSEIIGNFNTPVGDRAALRIDAAKVESGGTWTNSNNGEEFGNSDSKNVRVRFVATPMDRLTIDYTYTWLDRDSNPQPVFEVPQSQLDGGYRIDFVTFSYRNTKLSNPTAYPSDNFAYPVSDQIRNTYEVDRHTLRLDWESDSFMTSLLLAGTDEQIENAVDANNGLGGSPMFAIMGIVDFAPPGFNIVPQPSLVDLDGNFIPDSFPVVGGQPIQDREDFSAELRFQSTGDGKFNWAFGAFFSRLEYTDILETGYDVPDSTFDAAAAWVDPTVPFDPMSQVVVNTGLFPATYSCDVMSGFNCMGPPQLLDYWGRGNVLSEKFFTNEESSVFVSLGYALNDKTRIQFEARQVWEKREMDDIREVTLTYPNTYDEKQSKSFSDFLPRLIVDYQLNDNVFLYASAAKGQKAGGIQPSRPATGPSFYEPETNWTYELGTKMEMLDGHLNVNFTAFYIDWDEMQLRENVNLETIVTNIGKAEVTGFELMGAWRVHENVQFRYGYTYQDGEIKEGSTSSARGFCDMPNLERETVPISSTQAGILFFDPVGSALCNLQLAPPGIPFVSGGTVDLTTGNVAGNRLSNSPKNTMVYGLDVNIPLSNGLEFFTGIDYTWRSSTYSDFENYTKLDDTTLVSGQIGIATDSWSLYAWGQNLTDEDTPVAAIRTFNILGQTGTAIQQRNGRMLGVTLKYDF